MPVVKLTEPVVRAFQLPEVGQRLVYDAALAGFGIRLSRSTKSFFAERRLHGKTKRITIGPHPHLSVDTARRAAQVILGELVQGIDRKAIEHHARLKAVTLSQSFEQFKQAKKSLAPRTIADYEDLLTRLLGDWMRRPWVEISAQMILKRHAEIGKDNGPTTANHAIAVFGTIFRFAMKFYRDDGGRPLVFECPTDILTDTDSWFPQRPREKYIKPSELAAWWKAVHKLENITARDLLILYLLTGLRPAEGRTLKWSDIDLVHRTITLTKTKNKKTHVLPIGSYLAGVLAERSRGVKGEFVFPGEGEHGCIVDVRKSIAKVTKSCGITFTPHDLRRTFSNCLESADVTFYAHKKLMNHSLSRDVTFRHYLSLDVERLREPMEKVHRFILRHAGAVQTADVVALNPQTVEAA